MPPNCMASTVGSSYYPYGRSEGIAVVSQQSRAKGAPDTHEQDGCAATPSLDEVLAEVDPFLEVIGAREWRECAHHLVLTNIDRPAQDRIRVDALFTPGFVMESTTIRYPGKSSFREWRGKAYSDARFLSPELSPNIFKDRSVPALNTLVNLLLSSGMSIGGDFRDILVDSSVGQTLSLGNQVYGGAGTPLDAIIKGICIIERMIHEPTPKQVYDRGSLTIQLDYMFGVFEVLMNAGASCRPCGRDPGSATRGTLYLPCASPWQCGPSSHSGRVFSSLLSAGASLCPNLCELEEASRKHSAWKVQELLRLRVGDLENDLGDVLFQAVEWSAESAEEEEMQIEIIGHLVQAGARQEQEADIYRPRDVLTTAIVSGCGLRVVECLVGLGAKISPGTSVETQMCSVEVVEYLSRNATTANFRVWEMPTILHRLFPGSWCDEVDPNCLAKLRYLVEAGADVNAREEDGQTPLTAYLSNVAVPDVLVVQALLDAGADPNCNDSLYWSLSRGSLSPEVIRLLIQHGADVNKAVMVDQGQTPLHMLCRSDVADLHALSQVFEILIDSGANMNAKNNYGYTPLHAVCDYLWLKSGLINIPSVADLLVAAGTDLNAAGPYGETPLHLAVSRHRTANIVTIVDVLVTAGANVNAANNNGRTPLHLAAIQGNTLAIECLIAAGADVNILDPRGGGLLHYAACSPYAFPASFPSAYTWAANLDINARDYKGRSPLHWAARGPHNWENLEVMLKAGADINARDHRGCTPLHHAARLGTPRISKRLVSAGADVDALDQQGDTPLASAARAGAYKGIIQLLKAGVKAPDTIFEFGEPLAIQRMDFRYASIFSRLRGMVRFLEEAPTSLAPARQQLQTTLLANLHDVYKNYSLRALQEWSFKLDYVLEKLRDYLPVHDMQVRMLGQGGFGDCYVGTFFGISVVSKRLRFGYEPEKYMRHLLHEASIWRQLNHPNIIPLLGMPSIDGLPHLMSPLMRNGAADDFVKKNPNVNRVRLLVQIAQGLEYMHTRNPPIIHGDLKANNILISDDESACISDFGLSRVCDEAGPVAAHVTHGSFAPAPITMAYHANFRWGAPEVILDDMHRTQASDIFTLGRLMVELLTGKIPFPGLPDRVIIQHIHTGWYDRPTDSDAITCGLDDEMWALILECWNRDPLKRPSAAQVVERLKRMPEPASMDPSWEPCAAKAGDGDTSSDSSSGSSFSSVATDSTAVFEPMDADQWSMKYGQDYF